MAYKIAALALFASLFTLPAVSSAHSGGLDSRGCHTNRKTGEYHCHRAQPSGGDVAPGTTTTRPVVKKSKSGICHDHESQYYSRTTNYTAYGTMAACLASGGRRPK